METNVHTTSFGTTVDALYTTQTFAWLSPVSASTCPAHEKFLDRCRVNQG